MPLTQMLGAMTALIERKACDDGSHNSKVEQPFVLMNQQRCQQEVVDGEE